MQQFGIFSDESADWTEEEAVECGFYTKEEAETALHTRYHEDDELVVHVIEEDEEDEEDVFNSDDYPAKY